MIRLLDRFRSVAPAAVPPTSPAAYAVGSGRSRRRPSRRSRWWWRIARRGLLGLGASALLVSVALMVRPPPPASIEVLSAARDLPAGATLTAADLATTTIPTSGGPPVALGVDERAAAVGRSLVGQMAAGELVTRTRFVPREAAEGVPTGRVAVHLVLADERAAAQLSAGQRVTLYPAAGGPPWTRRALILGVDSLPDPTGCAGGFTGATPAAPGLTVALTPEEADAIHAGQRANEGPIPVLATPG